MRANFWVVVAACAALLLVLPSRSAWAEEKEKEEKDEAKVKIEQVPAAVRATLDKESGGAKIEEVDKETDEGKTIYEADVMIDGQNYEIKVAEDGKLISKKMDNEEGEKKGEKKGEKEEDEKNEKK